MSRLLFSMHIEVATDRTFSICNLRYLMQIRICTNATRKKSGTEIEIRIVH